MTKGQTRHDAATGFEKLDHALGVTVDQVTLNWLNEQRGGHPRGAPLLPMSVVLRDLIEFAMSSQSPRPMLPGLRYDSRNKKDTVVVHDRYQIKHPRHWTEEDVWAIAFQSCGSGARIVMPEKEFKAQFMPAVKP